MNVEIRHIRRGAAGRVNVRTERFAGERLTIGRASHNALQLPDPRILLDHAVIERKDGGFRFSTDAAEITKVDGKEVSQIALTPGIVVSMGPYQVGVEKPGDGIDLILCVELVVPLDDAAQIMRDAHKSAIDRDKRVLAWVSITAFVVVLGVAFVWPLMSELGQKDVPPTAGTWDRAQPLGRSQWDTRHIWTVGALSTPHGFLEQQCEACHEKPLARVPVQKCTTCHSDIAHHVDPDDLSVPTIQQAPCGACHKEHAPDGNIIVESQQFCSTCHEDGIKAGGVDLASAHDFELGHPDFRPRVATDVRNLKFERMPLRKSGVLKEDTTFRFPHHVHLSKQSNTQLGPEAERVLACTDCHAPDREAPRLRPVKMETHCRECHKLEFKAGSVTRRLPHGDPYGVQLVVTDIVRKAEIEQTRLRLKYSSIPPDTKNLLDDLETRVERKASEQLSVVFSNACGACHTVRPGKPDDAQKYHIEPFVMPRHWMVKARFDHPAHETIACGSCHADAKTSTKATDLLLPGIDTCRGCHGGEETKTKVVSSCIMCHDFHIHGRPTMAPE